MRAIAWLLAILSMAWLVTLITCAVLANYHYSQQIDSFWQLSVKASTIQKKSAYLDQYTAALKNSAMAPNDALVLATPDNSFEHNMDTLSSLQQRMHEIINMNPSSFEYQQAMAQITGQEQNEATDMLNVFEGCWYLQNHFWLWNWILVLHFTVCILAVFFSLCFAWAESLNE